MDLLINIDGGSRGNPGPAAAGVVIRSLPDRTIVHEAGYHLGHATNNVAEYNGLLKALDVVGRIAAYDGGKVLIQSDSQLMVRQVTGEYRMKSPDLKPLLEEAKAKLARLGPWQIRHVMREENRRADELANMAMDAGRDVVVIAGDGTAMTAGATAQRGAAARAAAPRHVSPASRGTPARAAGVEPGLFDAPALFTARLASSPGALCPAHTPANTPFAFGPGTPPRFCVFAAQAVFDENPTLWKEANTTEAQTRCGKCGVTIHIERAG
jgi:ribonuclease HI